MCKVHVEQSNGLAPIKQNELYKLSTWVDEGYRLSCQATVIANCIVTVPEDPLKAAIRAKIAEQKKNKEL